MVRLTMKTQKSIDHFLGLGYFIHPIPLAAVAMMVLNDRILKHQFPGWISGKLSDFAGIFFMPLFLCALINVGRNFGQNKKFCWISSAQLVGAILSVDLIFVAIKLFPFCAAWYVSVMTSIGFPSRVVQDPTDLIALTMNWATYLFARSSFDDQNGARKVTVVETRKHV
jgi:hypothetical protein